MREPLLQDRAQNDQSFEQAGSITIAAQIIQPASEQSVLQFDQPEHVVQAGM
ncbi:hypothetical protein [Acetobacter sp. AAB5]|uniref:hypothetical protein n=1 Tax=Acetobacter sp. AAB5 TaxID=3418370 RepID=UPI003CEAD9DA